MAYPGVKVVYLKVWFAIPFLKGEGTNLTLSIVHFSQEHADSCGYTFVALGHTWRHPWTRLAGRRLRHPQQLFFSQFPRPLFGQP